MATFLSINSPGYVPNVPGPQGYWKAVEKSLAATKRPSAHISNQNVKPAASLSAAKLTQMARTRKFASE